MNCIRPVLVAGIAALGMALSGCVVAPVAPRPVAYRAARVYAPPVVVVRPAPRPYHCGWRRCW